MAASDPTPYVATPTGTLQGVAAFSWDGSAWQPSGRAGPDVATPTGVLQGVAAFNGGPAWQPSGRAQPGVATPSGVLDGVAVYTWSGSAWTPAYGGPSCSTPSGVLRGVAAFNWDGSAWQPAAQARSSVPTPYGVLDGVAMFGWTGSAWAAVGAPSLSLDFMTSGTLDARITFTRASTGTYFDSSGTMQTAATNAPRFDYDPATHAARGLLIEEQRTNLLLTSVIGAGWSLNNTTLTAGAAGAPDGTATMTRVVETTAAAYHDVERLTAVAASTTYTASIYAKAMETRWLQIFFDNGAGVGGYATFDLQTGTISGPLTALGAGVIGTAAIQNTGNGIYRCSIATTIGANTSSRLGFALANSAAPAWPPSYTGNAANGLLMWGAQLEAGAFPTSYIPTTAAAVTRSADIATVPVGAWFNASAFSVMAAAMSSTPGANGIIFSLCDAGGAANRLQATLNADRSTTTVLSSGGANSVVNPETTFITTTGTPYKFGSSVTAGQYRSALNGVFSYSATAGVVVPAGVTQLALGQYVGGNIIQLNGYLRQITYWPRALSAAELQSVTT